MDWPATVLVDLDNTLHDYRGAAAAARSALAARLEHEHAIPREEFLARYLQLLTAEEDATFASGRELRTARLAALLATWPETCHANPAPYAEFLEKSLLDRIRPFEGALEALRRIESKARTMVVTEGYADTQAAIAERLGLAVDEARFLATKPHAVRKKDGSAFRLACELLGAVPEEAVVVGDNWDWDVLGSATAGLWQIWVALDAAADRAPPKRHLGRVAAFREVPAFIAANWGTKP